MVLHIVELALRNDFAVIDDDNAIGMSQKLDLVRDEHARGVAQDAQQTLIHKPPRHVCVHSRQRVVEQEDVGTAIHSTGQLHASFLAARKVDATLTDLSLSASGQDFDVGVQSARAQRRIKLGRVVRRRERDVVLEARVADPARLGHVRHVPRARDGAAELVDFAQQRRQQRRLAAAHPPRDHDQLALL